MGLCASAPADKYSVTTKQETGKQNTCAESEGRGDAATKQLVQPIPQPDKQILAVRAAEKAAPGRQPSSALAQGAGQQTCGGPAGLKLAEAVCPPDELIGNIIDPINGPAAGLPYKVHYLGPPLPPCEGERLATARALGRIDDPSEDPEITNILQLCSSIFAAPVSLCALFDDQRVFISEQDGSVIPRGNFPWRWTLCGWSLAFKNPQILVIPDTHQDARFANNLKVTAPPHVRFYCGAPLVASNGHRLGTLCFADVKPRTFDQASCMIMNNLSELVVRQLEKGIALKAKAKDNSNLAATYGQLQRAFDAFEHCVLLLDVSKENGWKVMYTNNMLQKLTGLVRDDVMGKLIQDLFEEGDGSSVLTVGLQQAVANNKNYRVRVARVCGTGSSGTAVTLTFRPAAKEHLDEHTMQIGVPAFLPVKGGEDSGAAQQKLYFVTVDTLTTPMSGSSNLGSSNPSSGRLSGLLSTNAVGAEIEGLEVGHLLGRGTFGSVYYGTYNNAQVAIKVIESDASKTGPLLEAVLSQQMNHPHVVSTLKYFHRTMKPSAPASIHDSAASPLHSGLGMQDFAGMGRNTLLEAGDSATGSGWNQAKKGTSNDGGGALSSGTNSGANALSASNAVAIDTTAQLAPEISTLAPAASSAAPGSPPLRPAANSTSGAAMGSCSDRGGSGTRGRREWRQTWLVMEYADCGSLQEVLDRGWMHLDRSNVARGPNIAAMLATAAEIASALQYLHGKQIVHGDLSGWNIMLCSKGATAAVGGRNFVAKVGDFGLSRSLDVSNEIMTKSYGTLTHQPPETLMHGIVSRATDVYSFGVLMWQMYTGSRPWCGLSHAQVIMQVGNQGAKLKWPSNTPPSLRSLAEACMHADVSVRPTFDDIVTHLEALQKELIAADGSGPELGLEVQWL